MSASPASSRFTDKRKLRMAIVTAIGVTAWALPAALAALFHSPECLWLYLADILGWAKVGKTSR